jgi:hypothetical protein
MKKIIPFLCLSFATLGNSFAQSVLVEYSDGGICRKHPTEFTSYQIIFPPTAKAIEDSKIEVCQNIAKAIITCIPKRERTPDWRPYITYKSDEYMRTKQKCITEDEYQDLKIMFAEDLVNAKNIMEKRVDEDKRIAATTVKKEQEIAKLCSGRPRVDQNSIETISRKFRINPNSISLQRVRINAFAKCEATFYYPGGVFACSTLDSINGNLIFDARTCE